MNFVEEIQVAAKATIEETGCLTLLSAHCAHAFGWAGSLPSWRSRVSQWGNASDPHRFPMEAIPIIVMCSGRDPFTSIILRAGMTDLSALPDHIACQIRRPGMRKVEPPYRDRRQGVA